MSDQTNRILNEICEDEKFIEVHTLYFESLKKNIRQSEKFRRCNVDENKDSTIQQNNEIIIFLINNFEMQKQRCCIFIICNELVF